MRGGVINHYVHCRQLSSQACQVLSECTASMNTQTYLHQMLPVALHHVDKDRVRCVALRNIAENIPKIVKDDSGSPNLLLK